MRGSVISVWLAVFAGGALGGAARYGVSVVLARMPGRAFPWGTLASNVSGAFALGVFAGGGWADASAGGGLDAFVAVGFCGGLTTFSGLGFQSLVMLNERRHGKVALNVGANLALGLAAVAGGIELVRGPG